jgi:hypothetical protein
MRAATKKAATMYSFETADLRLDATKYQINEMIELAAPIYVSMPTFTSSNYIGFP